MKRLLHWARRLGLAQTWGAGLLILLLFMRVMDPLPIEELRLRTFDLFQVIEPRAATQRPVVIVDIDDLSLSRLGQWPWPRTRLADLITELAKLGALVIAFDIVFSEPDRLSPQIAVEAFRGLDEETRNRLRMLVNNDEIMAGALKTTKVVLGESGLSSIVQLSNTTAAPYGVATLGSDPRPFLLNFPSLLRNISILEKAAVGHGLFSIRSERDGIVRRVPMVMMAQNQIVPSLTFEVLRVATGASTILIKSDNSGIKSVTIPGFELPTDSNGQIWIHFAPHDRGRYVSAVDVLEGRVPSERIAGKLVLVGTSAAGLLDLKTTSTEPSMPGVEVHAQVLESMLTASILTSPNYALPLELVAASVMGIIVIAFAPLLRLRYLLAFGAIIFVLPPAASWHAFKQNKLLIDFTFPLLSTMLIYLMLVFTNYAKEQAQRQRIRSAFGQYLSPTLVEQLAKTPDKLVLGGEQREMTILFSDMRGFTTISEFFKDDPQSLTALMNSFLTPLTNAIIDHKGTIDKYMGDAIMAFWNAPLYDPSHEINACEAALDMLDRLERLNREREQQARNSGVQFISLDVGIGINTGPCVVGNLGSDLRFDYSVLGDTVNLASRLQGQCKSYGVPVIIGPKTALAAKDRFAIVELDFIRVKGKMEAELVYAIVGRYDVAISPRFQYWRDINTEMLSQYRKRNWAGALAAIERSCAVDGERQFEVLRNVYVDRIRAFQITPPPDDWDGAYAPERIR